jgi:hypothetical protein
MVCIYSFVYLLNYKNIQCRSACGSSQPDVALSIEYPSSSCDIAPHAPSQPIRKRKREGKPIGKAKAKKTKGATTTKLKQPLVPASPQSPAICTRSETQESLAMSTRSERKILE